MSLQLLGSQRRKVDHQAIAPHIHEAWLEIHVASERGSTSATSLAR